MVDEGRDLSDSAPLDWSEIREVINLVVWINDALLLGWEVWISEHLASAVVLVQDGVERVWVFVKSALHDMKKEWISKI